MLRALIFACALALSSLAGAADPAQPIVISDVAKFIAHQQALRSDMQDGKKFSHVDEEAKQRLFAAQDKLFAVLKGKHAISELNDQERITVYNAENEVAAVLQDAELDRPICEQQHKMGSHRNEVVCASRRQRDSEMAEWRTRLTSPRSCGTGEFCKGG